MILYHYTSVSLAEAILSSAISKGHLVQSDGGILQPVVWLTTEPRAWGHGLTTGSERLTSSEVAFSERVQGGPMRNYKTVDKTRMRLAVEIVPANSPRLMSFMDYARTYESKAFAKRLGISAQYKLDKLSPKDYHRLSRTAKTMESTWWLSFEPVPASALVTVDIFVAGRFSPYRFEAHGRDAMRELGFATPSAGALSELAQILMPSHPFEEAKAILICSDPSETPKVTIRGGGKTRAFEIVGAVPLGGSDDDSQIATLWTWIDSHRLELLHCWNEAIELYFVAYPKRRP